MLSKEPNLTPMVEVEEGVQDDLWGGENERLEAYLLWSEMEEVNYR